jgi:hypothetical protein
LADASFVFSTTILSFIRRAAVMMSDRGNPTPAMDSFQSRLKSSIERYVAIFLALALLGALWSTALARISDRSTATTLLTRAGTDIINPILLAKGSGIGQDLYQQIQQQAKAQPNQPVALGFLKVTIPGREIAGKSFAQGSQIIYAHVADAYYDGGPNAAFALPPQLQQIVGSYTPFVQSDATANVTGLPQVPLPQLPSFASALYTHIGITPTSLTAGGHNAAVGQSLWLWIVSIALAAILILINTGWNRLWAVAWPLFHSSWHIALIGIIGTIIVSHNIANAAAYKGVLDIVGGTFFPVFYVAAALGIVAVAVSLIGSHISQQQTSPELTAEGARSERAGGFAAMMPPTAPPAHARPEGESGAPPQTGAES